MTPNTNQPIQRLTASAEAPTIGSWRLRRHDPLNWVREDRIAELEAEIAARAL